MNLLNVRFLSILTFFILMTLSPANAQEQTSTEHLETNKYNFRLNLLKGVGIHLDREINKAFTLGLLMSTEMDFISYGGLVEKYVGMEGNYYFVKDHNVNGWVGTAFAKLGRARVVSVDLYEQDPVLMTDSAAMKVGALVGYQWIWDHFNLQLKGGLAYRYLQDHNKDWMHATFPINFSLGWAF